MKIPTRPSWFDSIPADASGFDPRHWLEALPELQALDGCAQDPEHHPEVDAWVHTRLVVEALLAQPDYAAASPERRRVLFLAALLHDCAKPARTRIDGGRIVSPGHSPAGAVMARQALWARGLPLEERELVCRLIARHQIPFNWHRRSEPLEYWVRLVSVESSCADLALLARCDILGRGACPSQTEGLVHCELFAEQARLSGCFDAPSAFFSDESRFAYFAAQGRALDDAALAAPPPGFALTIVCGPPASGKDFWIAREGLENHVSMDQWREAKGFRHGSSDEGTVRREAAEKLKTFLRAKTDCCWNSTLLRTEQRQRVVQLGLDYGARVEIVSLEAPKALLLSRNGRRGGTLPDAKLLAMASGWQAPIPSEAHRVRLVENL